GKQIVVKPSLEWLQRLAHPLLEGLDRIVVPLERLDVALQLGRAELLPLKSKVIRQGPTGEVVTVGNLLLSGVGDDELPRAGAEQLRQGYQLPLGQHRL